MHLDRKRVLQKIEGFPYYIPENRKKSQLKVACILDRFSYECFKYECELKYLSAISWKKDIEEFKPDFLLVESAWDGIDGTWAEKLFNFKTNEDDTIKEVINYCKNRNIKTVFWNKEDPPHYQQFIEVASLFDVVFTTDEESIPSYQRDLGHDRIYSLPFAAQPMIHNPINSKHDKKENVAFAGSWYDRYWIRQVEMKWLFDAAKEFDLHIYDRFRDREKYTFPQQYKNYIIGSLYYSEMLKAYKLYKIFINVNSVRDSSTMFSRRVYEMLASGANVVSTYSKGINKMFKGIVPLIFSEQEAFEVIRTLLANQEISDRLSLLGIREVNTKHLYSHRLNRILEKIGFQSIEDNKEVVVVSVVHDVYEVNNVLENFSRQKWEKKELLLIGDKKLKSHISTLNRSDITFIDVHDIQKNTYINQVLREKTRNKYIAHFNPVDHYAAYYLTDLMNAFNYTDADIVAKSTYYQYCKSTKLLTLENGTNEHIFTRDINFSTMIIRKGIMDKCDLFFYDELTGFAIKKELLQHFKCYSIDRFNYTKIIETESLNHLKENSSIVCFTKDFKTHVSVDEGYNFNQISEEKIEKIYDKVVKSIFHPDYPGLCEIIRKRLGNDLQKRILIYGGGEHTLRLLNIIDELNLNIIGVVDKNEKKHGRTIKNIQIYSPDEILSLNPELIIISSQTYESEIYKELSWLIHKGIDLFALYKENVQYEKDIFMELYLYDRNFM